MLLIMVIRRLKTETVIISDDFTTNDAENNS